MHVASSRVGCVSPMMLVLAVLVPRTVLMSVRLDRAGLPTRGHAVLGLVAATGRGREPPFPRDAEKENGDSDGDER